MKHRIKIISIMTFLSLIVSTSYSQTKFGTNPTMIDPSSVLELESTIKGFLMPKMSTAQINAISSPANALMVYDTTVRCVKYYNKPILTWECLATISQVKDSILKLEPWFSTVTNTGSISNTDSVYILGKVGIGTATPDTKLTVEGSDAGIHVKRYGTGAHLVLTTFGGTQAAPAVTPSGQLTGRMSAWSWDGTSRHPNGYLDIFASENQTATTRGGDIAFSTTINGGLSVTEKLRILNNGRVGIGTSAPTNKLHITGVGAINPLRLDSLQAGAASDSVMTVDANGVVRKRNAAAFGAGTEPWFSTATNSGSISNTDSIYIMGRVGIGTKTPTFNLNVMDTSGGSPVIGMDGGSYPSYYNTSYNGYPGANATGHSMIAGRIANGTKANPTAITTGRTISAFGAYYHNGTSFIEGSRLNFYAYTPSAGRYPLGITFFKNLPNGTGSSALEIDSINNYTYPSPAGNTTHFSNFNGDSIVKFNINGTDSAGFVQFRATSGSISGYLYTMGQAQPLYPGLEQYGPRVVNLDASGGNLHLSTNSLRPIRFYTNSIFRMILDSIGNLGIGLKTPTNKLHVTATSNPLRLEGLQYGATSDSVLTANSIGVVRKISANDLVSNSKNFVVTAVAAYTILASDHTVLANGTATTFTLPTAASSTNRELRLVNHCTSNATLSIAVQTGNGLTTTTLGTFSGTNSITIMSDGTTWFKVGN